MSFTDYIKTAEASQIVELYEFESGGYVWRYSSGRSATTFLGSSYKPASIKRNSVATDETAGNKTVTISAAILAPADAGFDVVPPAETAVRIYKCVAAAPTNYSKIFEGVVEKTSCQSGVLQLSCASGGALAVKLPKIIHQSYCNWQVFDCDCGLDYTLWEVAAVVTLSSGGSTLTSATFGAKADGYWTQGWARFGADYRFITSHSGNNITLHVPFGSDLVDDSTVYSIPGCDGSPDTCKDKFDNWRRYVGMPTIPSNNPVLWGLK